MAESNQINYYNQKINKEAMKQEQTNTNYNINNVYSIPNNYKIVKWNKNKYPLYINHCVFDSEGLTDWIAQWLREFKYNKLYSYNSALSLNKRLYIAFRSLNTRTILIQKLITRLQDEEQLELLSDFMNGAIKINNKLQNVLNQCTNCMISKKDTTKISTNHDIKLYILQCMNVLFNIDNNLYKLQAIEDSINIWIQRFDANCTF